MIELTTSSGVGIIDFDRAIYGSYAHIVVGFGDVPNLSVLSRPTGKILMGWATNSGANFLGAYTTTNMNVSRTGTGSSATAPLIYTFQLGKSDLTIQAVASEAPTWVMITTSSNSSWASTNKTHTSYQSLLDASTANMAADYCSILMLTCGDETSDAEVRLLGGQVVAGSQYRLSSFTVEI